MSASPPPPGAASSNQHPASARSNGQARWQADACQDRRAYRTAHAGQAWLFIRVTGLLLSVLVLGHLLAVHLLTDVARTTSSFVARRWSTWLWVSWDGCMLTVALAHGAAGLYAVVRDFTAPGWARRAVAVILWLIAAALAAVGWYTVTVVAGAVAAAR